MPSADDLQYCSQYNKDEKCASVFSSSEDRVLERGCISSLSTENKIACNSNSENCIKCSHDKCNKVDSKLKTDFCIECNSADDVDCAKSNPIYEARCSSAKCFTRLVPNKDNWNNNTLITERGCFDDLSSACVAPDCVACTGKNCNVKVFPANRISCKSCKLHECKRGVGIDKVCNVMSAKESCITVYGQGINEVLMRDCYADAKNGTRIVCDDETDLFGSKCQGNLCNVDTKRRGSKCFRCEGLDCAHDFSDVVDCLSDCFVGVTPLGLPKKDCASAVPNSHICGQSNQTCLTCNEDYCNGITFPLQDRLTCIKCVGGDCVNLTTVSEYCERLSPSENCFTLFDESGVVAQRGCSATIENAGKCKTATPCIYCGSDNCNVANTPNETFRCIACNSEEETNCVANPNATQVVGCTTNQCYSQLLGSNGVGQHIVRGCAAGIACSGTSCARCSGNRCNSQQFPSTRHSCYHCEGDQCALGSLREKICTLYSQDKNCVTVYGNGEIILITAEYLLKF